VNELASPVGVYVHYPYCEHRCVYCDFALTTPRVAPAERYTDAVLAELTLRMGPGPIAARTFYVGGGTPSLWPTAELARVLARVRLEDGAEVTLEANPEQCDAAWLEGVVALGVNRVSLGVQSLDARELALLTRRHGVAGAEAALDALADAHARGRLASWSADLMYGLPGQGEEAALAQLERLVTRWSPPHLSLYALTVEPRTPMARDIRRGVLAPPDDGVQGALLFAARAHLGALGYAHYEVSSWARPGHGARHNSAYWDLSPYLGLGAGAHGFMGGERWANLARPSRYIDEALAGRVPVQASERPDARTLAFERLMTGLRRLDVGVTWGEDLAPFDAGLAAEVARGRLTRDGERLRVTDLGLRYLDDVLAALL